MNNIAEVKFAKVHPNAVIPSKRDEDMGWDIYACFDDDYIHFDAHETKLVPTGIASACDPEYGFLLFERGSTGSKGIARRCGVLDSGYRGEWFVCLTNTSDKDMYISKLTKDELIDRKLESEKDNPFMKVFSSITKNYFDDVIIYPYSKAIAQALLIPVPKTNVAEVSYDDLKAIKSERGMGALGSSNK